MSDFFYKAVRTIGRPLVFGATQKLVLNEERAQLKGGCLLAANHQSYFDSMVLMGTTTRLIDWLSITELFQTPWQRFFMSRLNCLALDRSGPDVVTTREVIRRLRAGRLVGFFPEGELRQGNDSVLSGGMLNPGSARLATAADVPILPVVILGAEGFCEPRAWVPGAGTFIAVNYGEPIFPENGLPEKEAREKLDRDLRAAFPDLVTELQLHPDWPEKLGGPCLAENIQNK